MTFSEFLFQMKRPWNNQQNAKKINSIYMEDRTEKTNFRNLYKSCGRDSIVKDQELLF